LKVPEAPEKFQNDWSIIGMNTVVYSEIERMFFEEKRTYQEISKILEMEMNEVDSIVCDIIAKETSSGVN
jgi:phosphopantetheine adenylyltransferase